MVRLPRKPGTHRTLIGHLRLEKNYPLAAEMHSLSEQFENLFRPEQAEPTNGVICEVVHEALSELRVHFERQIRPCATPPPFLKNRTQENNCCLLTSCEGASGDCVLPKQRLEQIAAGGFRYFAIAQVSCRRHNANAWRSTELPCRVRLQSRHHSIPP